MKSVDLRVILDFGLGWLLARFFWLTLDELLVKPLLRRCYKKADLLLKDKLPDIDD
jgi:hypothetical protein